MNNIEEYFCPIPGSKDEEKIVIFARKHWIAFLGHIIIGAVLLFIPIVIYLVSIANNSNIFHGILLNFLVVGLSVYYLVITTFVFTTWITFYYDIYILTEDQIVDITQQGFLGRNISQLSLIRIQDVSSSVHGFWPTLFGYGDVIIETAGERSETFHLKSIPNPQAFSAKVLEIHNQLIESSGRQSQIAQGEGTVTPFYEKTITGKPLNNTSLQPPATPPKASPKSEQGEISRDDLGKGGEIKF